MSELRNMREAVELLDELVTNLEVVKEDLSKNFSNYKAVNTASDKAIDNLNAILKRIAELEISANNIANEAVKKVEDLRSELAKYYSDEYAQTKRDFDALLSSMRKEIFELKVEIAKQIQNSIDDLEIDTSEIEAILNSKIKAINISPLKASILKANETAKMVDSAVDSLYQKGEEINSAISSLNSANRAVSGVVAATLLFVGVVVGFATASFFKIDAISNYYFSQYDQKIEQEKKRNDELQELIGRSNGLVKFLLRHRTKVTYGVFEDSKIPYLGVARGRYLGIDKKDPQKWVFIQVGDRQRPK